MKGGQVGRVLPCSLLRPESQSRGYRVSTAGQTDTNLFLLELYRSHTERQLGQRSFYTLKTATGNLPEVPQARVLP